MNDTLFNLRQYALSHSTLRKALLHTYTEPNPLEAFCALATSAGFPLTPESIIAGGEEFSCSQTKSTNGGNPLPYEMFLISIS